MIEKWLLVLLIVGCTSLVFLICFPIDFYLYRRRKRLARERKNLTLPWYRPQTPTRAAQVHATLTITQVAAEIDFEEMNAKDRKAYRAQRGIMRFLSKIRRKSNRQKLQERLADSKSENSSDCRILTTPETTHTLASAEFKNKHIFRDHNDPSCNLHAHEFNEMTRDGKVGPFDSHEGDFGQACGRKVSDASNIWGENDELVDHEIKQLNYGAFEPLANITHFTNEAAEPDTNCFTIPVRGRNVVHMKPGHDGTESYTEFGKHKTNSSSQDIIVENKTERGQSDMATGNSDENIKLGHTCDKNNSDSEYHDEDTGRERLSISQELSDIDGELGIKKQGRLLHSNSDQCVSYNSKHSSASVPFKSRRKGNAVSPTDHFTSSSSSEHFCVDNKEKQNSYLGKRRSVSLSTALQEAPFISNMKSKKKKGSLSNPPNFMPELKRYHSYHKEKF